MIQVLEMTENQLAERIGVKNQTLRTYLDGWQFTNVLKREVWFLKPGHKRNSKTFKYTLTNVDIHNLLKLRNRKKAKRGYKAD